MLHHLWGVRCWENRELQVHCATPPLHYKFSGKRVKSQNWAGTWSKHYTWGLIYCSSTHNLHTLVCYKAGFVVPHLLTSSLDYALYSSLRQTLAVVDCVVMVSSAGQSCTRGVWECSDSDEQQQFPVWQVPWACLQQWWPRDGRYVPMHYIWTVEWEIFCCCKVTLCTGVVGECIVHSLPPKPTSRSIYWRSLVWSSRERERGTSTSSTRCLLDYLQRRRRCWSWMIPANTGCVATYTSGSDLAAPTQLISVFSICILQPGVWWGLC